MEHGSNRYQKKVDGSNDPSTISNEDAANTAGIKFLDPLVRKCETVENLAHALEISSAGFARVCCHWQQFTRLKSTILSYICRKAAKFRMELRENTDRKS